MSTLSEKRAELIRRRMSTGESSRKEWDEVLNAYGRCELCGGDGMKYLYGKQSPCGHRTCLSCQGHGLSDGWRNQWFKDFQAAQESAAKGGQHEDA